MSYQQNEDSDWGSLFVEEGEIVYNLEERLLEYSCRTIRLTEQIHPTRAGKHIADQLLRSSTSPLGNHGEAQAAESTKDFVHKIKLVLKELKESLRWIKLIKRVLWSNTLKNSMTYSTKLINLSEFSPSVSKPHRNDSSGAASLEHSTSNI